MNIKGFRRMLVGEKMPDKNDPQYKDRYERDVNAGRKFAKATPGLCQQKQDSVFGHGIRICHRYIHIQHLSLGESLPPRTRNEKCHGSTRQPAQQTAQRFGKSHS